MTPTGKAWSPFEALWSPFETHCCCCGWWWNATNLLDFVNSIHIVSQERDITGVVYISPDCLDLLFFRAEHRREPSTKLKPIWGGIVGKIPSWGRNKPKQVRGCQPGLRHASYTMFSVNIAEAPFGLGTGPGQTTEQWSREKFSLLLPPRGWNREDPLSKI